MFNTLKDAISAALATGYGYKHVPLLARPPNLAFGDLTWNAGPVGKELGVNAVEIAAHVGKALASHPSVKTAETRGVFLNITLHTDALFGAATKAAVSPADDIRQKPETVMVEYLSPNTNKPLHLGHVRNGVLGSALIGILKAVGHQVIGANLVNDRGIHICKSMLMYDRFGKNETPESTGEKGDHFIGRYYVMFEAEFRKEVDAYLVQHEVDYLMWCQERIAANGSGMPEEELRAEWRALFSEKYFTRIPLGAAAQAMLLAWENDDPKVRTLWKRMNEWAFAGFDETYARLGFSFDRLYFESDLYQSGKDIVQAGLDKGVFTKFDDGAVGLVLPVEDFGLDKDKQPRKVSFLRADGTSLYTTQDLGTAVKKATDYPLDRSIYVVACEQDLHFKQLFYALDLLGYPWARKCFHFSYEMVELPSGKMKSREGTVVDADDLVEELAGRAREIMTARGSKERGNEFMRRADLIALAALKFFLLNFGSRTKVKFDPERSVDFEGDTGPYCLYAYARASTLLEKAVEAGVLDGVQMSASTFSVIGSEKERALAHAILELQTMVKTAAENYNPTLVAKAALALAQAFNRFYKEHKVVGEEAGLAQERAWLVIAAKEMLKWGLGVLGIETLERM